MNNTVGNKAETALAAPVGIAVTGTANWPALVALFLGMAVVGGAGLAAPSAIHNATHDTRHAFGLPCH